MADGRLLFQALMKYISYLKTATLSETIYIATLELIRIIVTRFWKTDHFVTFGIIYISVNLRHSIWHYWFNKWLNRSQTS